MIGRKVLSIIFTLTTVLVLFNLLAKDAQQQINIDHVEAGSPILLISDVYNVNETGKTILINITVSEVTDLQLWIINITFDPHHLRITTGDRTGVKYPRYPPSKVVYYNIYEGDFLKDLGTTGVFIMSGGRINNTAGEIVGLACSTSGGGKSGSGILARINFTVINVSRSEIRIVGSLLQDAKNKQPIPHLVDNGVVTYEPPPLPPIWSELWFQGTVGGITIVAGSIVIYKTVWKKVRAKHLLKLSREIQPIYEENEPNFEL